MTDQCAVGTDGNLKDASEIMWHNDQDDECPLPAPGPTTKKSTAPVHHFFTGARCSTRAPRPSMKIVDPDNVALSSSTQSKQKAVDGPGTSRRVAHKVIPASSASSDDAGDLDGEDNADCTDDDIIELVLRELLTKKKITMPPSKAPNEPRGVTPTTAPPTRCGRKTNTEKPLLAFSKHKSDHTIGTGICTDVKNLESTMRLLATHGLTTPSTGITFEVLVDYLFEFTITANLGVTHTDILRAFAIIIDDINQTKQTSTLMHKLAAALETPIEHLEA
ncbi:hypothetical protein BDR05DRAFT_945398 [Suillus weaverae]|nr:hypothetical protein BDR05DRAFT_945398 [Suillus weaverae]